MDRLFSEDGYEKTYEWALRLIKEYPNCNMLIWQTAVMLDARRITDKCTNQENILDGVKEKLLEGFREEEEFGYMAGYEPWEKLIFDR